MKRRVSNSGGFVYFEALFITMLLSMAAMLVMSGFREVQRINSETAVRTTALHFANARLAELQYQASGEFLNPGDKDYIGDRSDLTVEHLLGNEQSASDSGMTVVFDVNSNVNGTRATVTVTPTVNGKLKTDWAVTVTRIIETR